MLRDIHQLHTAYRTTHPISIPIPIFISTSFHLISPRLISPRPHRPASSLRLCVFVSVSVLVSILYWTEAAQALNLFRESRFNFHTIKAQLHRHRVPVIAEPQTERQTATHQREKSVERVKQLEERSSRVKARVKTRKLSISRHKRKKRHSR